MTLSTQRRTPRKTTRRKPAAPKLPPAALTEEQKQEAHARLDRMIEEGCWPIVFLGEMQNGAVLPLSAPFSETVVEGMVRRIASILFPENFE